MDQIKKGSRGCFAAIRTDGLGARLQALLNAIVLSERFDSDFRFSWPAKPSDMHAIVPPEDTFDKPFLQRHFSKNLNSAHAFDLGQISHSEDSIRSRLRTGTKVLAVQHWPLSQTITSLNAAEVGTSYVRSFKRIAFAEPIADVIAKASAIPLPDRSIAIHLRAGDIVYGNFRFMATYNGKVLAYPIAKHLISDLISNGKYPLIFGQDIPTCRLLARTFGLDLAIDYLPSQAAAPRVATALAEMTLMSRCESILSGSSAFSLLAGRIGNVVVTEPSALLSEEAVADIIVRDSAAMEAEQALPDLQKSFAYFTAVHAAGAALTIDEKLILLEKAVRHDSRNAFYRLMKAKLHLQLGDDHAAEAEVRRSITAGGEHTRPLEETTLFRVLSKKNSTGKPAIAGLMKPLAHMADYDHPACSLVVAIFEYSLGRFDAAETALKSSATLGRPAEDLARLVLRERQRS